MTLSAEDGDYFDRARDLVGATIEAARDGKPLPIDLPDNVIAAFDRFGRSLREGESIEIHPPSDLRTVIYDRRIRHKLVLLRSKTYVEEIDVVGSVVQFDWQRKVFDLLVGDGRVAARLDDLRDDQLAVVRTAGAHGDRIQVRLVGLGAFDSTDRLVRITEIADVGYAEDEALKKELDVERRLADLAKLRPGWLAGEGAALDGAGLSWLAGVLKQLESEGIPRPYLYPTPDGGIQAEWSWLGAAEVNVEIDLVRQRASAVGVHVRSQATRDDEFDLRDGEGISALATFVSRFGPEGVRSKP